LSRKEHERRVESKGKDGTEGKGRQEEGRIMRRERMFVCGAVCLEAPQQCEDEYGWDPYWHTLPRHGPLTTGREEKPEKWMRDF
jgi:hypothetical protein